MSKVGSAHRVCKTVPVAQVFGSLEKTGTVELIFEKLLFKKSSGSEPNITNQQKYTIQPPLRKRKTQVLDF